MNFPATSYPQLLKKSVIEFARKELNDDVVADDEAGVFPREKWDKCAKMDLFALQCPDEYGGSKEDLGATVAALEGLSYACKDGGLTHAIVTQLCCMVQLALFGDESHKRQFLPELACGRKIAAQAITEPDAGSDVTSMGAEAVPAGDGYRLNGSKTFISNGPVADVVTVFAVTDKERGKLGGISCFIVESGRPGFTKGRPLDKMGLRTLHNGELFFSDCKLERSDLLGREGQGMMIFGEVIEWERAFMAAVHLGTMQRVLEQCVRYAKTRKQFGAPIGKYQAISHKIADIKTRLELGRTMLQKAAWLKDQGKRATLETSICKLFVGESLKSACMEAVQIHGGYGFMKECEIERDFRDSVAATIYSGTSEMQRNIIASMAGV
jgi:alkylation response protein AidB-like acyl-CoA dehydrogenase